MSSQTTECHFDTWVLALTRNWVTGGWAGRGGVVERDESAVVNAALSPSALL